jgi:hypothetical protein
VRARVVGWTNAAHNTAQHSITHPHARPTHPYAPTQDGTLTSDLGGPRALLRHLFESTTFNLASSTSESRLRPDDGRLGLPLTFFLNADVLDALLEEAGGAPAAKPRVAYEDYAAALKS